MLMETKNKIMDSAFRLFADKGIVFSLSEVAKEVGIQKASIYAHFASKEELMYAIIEREATEYFLEINEHCDDLKSMFFLILNYYNKSKEKLYFWKRLLLLPPKSIEKMLNDKVNDLSRQRYELVRRLVALDIERGLIRCRDADAVAFSFFSMINGLSSSKIMFESEDLTRYYETIWQIFWHGIN
jgi:AcrR family transcriptional regulator